MQANVIAESGIEGLLAGIFQAALPRGRPNGTPRLAQPQVGTMGLQGEQAWDCVHGPAADGPCSSCSREAPNLLAWKLPWDMA